MLRQYKPIKIASIKFMNKRTEKSIDYAKK